MKKKFKYLAMLYIMFLILPFGYGIWVISKSATGVYKYGRTNSVPVAYIASEPSKQYTSIEKALDVATEKGGKQIIYVIPGSNPTVKEDIEIRSNQTLILPYNGEESGREDEVFTDAEGNNYEPYKTHRSGGLADENSTQVLKNRKNIIKINDGLTLTISTNGTLVIGGQLGENGTNIVGQTSGFYVEILLGEGASIVNNGKLDCYGYIKEDYTKAGYTVSDNHGSKVINTLNSSMYLPFVIYDFRGGSYTYGAHLSNVMPFGIFDFPNVQSLIEFDYGSNLIGRVRMPIRDSIYITSGNLIGIHDSDALFKMKSGKLTLKYTPANKNGFTTRDAQNGTSIENTSTTTKAVNITKMIFDGEMSVSSVIIEMEIFGINVKIDTSKYYLPLSYKFDFEIKSGSNITIPNKMKFMPGSSMVVDPGAILNINSDVIFYQKFVQQNEISKPYPSAYETGHPAELINNGILNLNSKFGGVIKTTQANATINVLSGFSNGVESKEGISTKTFTKLPTGINTHTISESAKAHYSEDVDYNPTNVIYTNLVSRSKVEKIKEWFEKAPLGISYCHVETLTSYSSYISMGIWWNLYYNAGEINQIDKTMVAGKTCDDFFNGGWQR